MNVDHYFTIGSSHQSQGTPCEDFALTGILQEGFAYGVVADGCSGANANTDIGARALACAFRRTVAQRIGGAGAWFSGTFHDQLLANFRNMRYDNEEVGDYLATVVGFVATPEAASVYIHGDGAIAIRYADGRLKLIELTWWDNTPYYLGYSLEQQEQDKFIRLYQNGFLEPFKQTITVWQKTSDGLDVLEASNERFILDQVIDGHILHFHPREEGIVAMAVLTDGVGQLGQTPAIEVATELLSFKNYEGSFVKRRMMRALRLFHKAGIIPRDDIGMAAVWFPPEA
ncbi:MAG: protein phosphatase 2C domain-containing protein [Agitococcus sp.]|nr:protein phosphatase 2C domain-containing protein [Agitococcus sp.]MDO9178677.1 protein phosphatase 2C domain-containing protein [Agitococcus sp.]